MGLQEIPPLTFAGMRYLLAFLWLMIVLFVTKGRSALRMLPEGRWGQLMLLGLLFYALTQGASFVALAYLPAVTVNLIWNFSSITVALMGMIWLSEHPTRLQWAGTLIALLGAVTYFVPVTIPGSQNIGLVVAVVGVLANAASSILGRAVNRTLATHPLVVTTVSMGAGSIALLAVGIGLEGIPSIDIKGWAIILWLAVVNTAFAFTLWNKTLQTLTAVESSIINSTMLIWIPVFAVTLLGETISPKELIGLIIVGAGTVIVQLRRWPLLDQEHS